MIIGSTLKPKSYGKISVVQIDIIRLEYELGYEHKN